MYISRILHIIYCSTDNQRSSWRKQHYIRPFPMLVATGSFPPQYYTVKLLNTHFWTTVGYSFTCYQGKVYLLKSSLWICHLKMIKMYWKLNMKSPFISAATWWSITLESSEWSYLYVPGISLAALFWMAWFRRVFFLFTISWKRNDTIKVLNRCILLAEYPAYLQILKGNYNIDIVHLPDLHKTII